MAKSKSFRVAVEGATVDGRIIQREHLEQIEANYNLETFTALVNCEHVRGYSPDAPFNCYGKILSVHTEEIQLTINGKAETKLALYAEIDANDNLIAINKAGQKLFTSIEIHPDFAGKGEAYLIGLAVTDKPASLGTEQLKFAAMSRSNIFSDAHETAIELEASLDANDIGAAVKTGFLSAFASLFKADDKPKDGDTPPAGSPPAPANDNFDMQAFAALMGDQVAAAVQPGNDAIAEFRTELTALKTKLAETPEGQSFTRQPAAGGTGVKTDC